MATLKYVLKFKIVNNKGDKINSQLEQVNIVPSTEIDESVFNMDKKALKTYLKKNSNATNYYFLPQDLKDTICSVVGQIDNNASMDSLRIEGNYLMSDKNYDKGKMVKITHGSNGASPIITIIDETRVQVDNNIFGINTEGAVAQMSGGKPKGGRTKRRKYRKKRKSKSSRKSRRKTAKK